MKKIFFLIILPALFVQFFLLSPNITPAYADSPTAINSQQGFGTGGYIPGAFGATDKPTDIRTIASNIIKAVLGLLGIIFVALLIFAGFKYMTSQGNEEQTSTAKKQIISAIIGLIIILSAYGITVFVTKSAINATNKSVRSQY